jgi:SAM-dependent methyltransferase
VSADRVRCRLCGHDSHDVVHDGPIRSGGAESGTEDGYRVLRCTACAIVFLEPLPPGLDDYYADDEYWKNHHGPLDIEDLHRKHDPEQARWFSEVGTATLRGRRVADFGCGAGIFLDHARAIAAETTGIDATPIFAEHLQSNGHRYLSDPDQLEPESVDVAVSFDTLEHVVDPVRFVSAIHRALDRNGLLFVGVPNQRDFLKALVPAYRPFFYHRSHLYYFDEQTLGNLLEMSGFTLLNTRFVHKYDLMNIVIWARDGVGRGKVGGDVFDERTERDFRIDLERQGIASHLLVEARRADR